MRVLTPGSLHLGLTLALGAAFALAPVDAAETSRRIVSLGGSVTEIVVALGAGDRLIARDSTSTHPESVLALPDVGYVRALSAEGVLALGPDLILAEDGAGPPEAVEVLQAAGVPFVTMPNAPSAEGIAAKIAAVAEAVGLQAEGAALAAEVKAGFDRAATRAAAVTAPRRVLFVLSLQGGGVMVGGEDSSAAGIIQLAGGINAASGFAGYKTMTDEAILLAAPDVILMMDREGDLAIGNAVIQAHPALAATPAAQAGAIIRMDGMLLLGFGPRTPKAAEDLHDALYPKAG